MNMHECVNHVQHPAETEDHWTSGACGQRLCLRDCTPQDASNESLVIQHKKGPKTAWEHNLCLCTQRSNPHFSSSFNHQRFPQCLSAMIRSKPKAFSYMLSLLTASMDPGQGLPQPTKSGACTGAHLCKSRLPQIGNHWNNEKNTTWRPAPKYSRHILTWSMHLHIKSASWSKNFLSPRHLGPFPQTARLTGKKHQLYRAVEVWKLEFSSTEVMLLWWLTPWEMKVSVASILSVLRWKNSNAVGCCRHILHGLDSCNSSLKPCITVIETNLMIRNMRDLETIGTRIRQDPLLSGWAIKKSIIGIKKNISLRKKWKYNM